MNLKKNSPLIFSVAVHGFLFLALLLVLFDQKEENSLNIPISLESVVSSTQMKKAFHRAIHQMKIPHAEPVGDVIQNEGAMGQSESMEEGQIGGGIEPNELEKYFQFIVKRLHQVKRYPKDAQFNEQEGVVEILLELSAEGKILKSELVKRAPYSSLNDAAILAVSQLGELPPLPLKPSGIPVNQPISIRVPIHFKLQK